MIGVSQRERMDGKSRCKQTPVCALTASENEKKFCGLSAGDTRNSLLDSDLTVREVTCIQGLSSQQIFQIASVYVRRGPVICRFKDEDGVASNFVYGVEKQSNYGPFQGWDACALKVYTSYKNLESLGMRSKPQKGSLTIGGISRYPSELILCEPVTSYSSEEPSAYYQSQQPFQELMKVASDIPLMSRNSNFDPKTSFDRKVCDGSGKPTLQQDSARDFLDRERAGAALWGIATAGSSCVIDPCDSDKSPTVLLPEDINYDGDKLLLRIDNNWQDFDQLFDMPIRIMTFLSLTDTLIIDSAKELLRRAHKQSLTSPVVVVREEKVAGNSPATTQNKLQMAFNAMAEDEYFALRLKHDCRAVSSVDDKGVTLLHTDGSSVASITVKWQQIHENIVSFVVFQSNEELSDRLSKGYADLDTLEAPLVRLVNHDLYNHFFGSKAGISILRR